MNRRSLSIAVLGTTCGLAACNAILGIDGTPVVAVHPSVDAGPDSWGCLANPAKPTSSTAPVAITFKIFDALASAPTTGAGGGTDFDVDDFDPVAGIAVEACHELDPNCLTPVQPSVTTEDAGEATVDVPQSFFGLFSFTGSDYFPEKLYPGRMLADASVFSPPLGVLAFEETRILGSALGVEVATSPDAGVGHAILEIYDCFDQQAAGVSFSLSADAGPTSAAFYYVGGFPDKAATETDSTGTGGVLNVPAGALIVTATLAATNQVIGASNIVVAPGGVTTVWFRTRTF